MKELTIEYINSHIGEVINWECFGYKGNLPYKGSCKLLGVSLDPDRIDRTTGLPLIRPCIEHISGDELKYGFNHYGTICYTDSDRAVLLQDTFNIYTAKWDTPSGPIEYGFVVKKGADPYEVAKKHTSATEFTVELTK